MVQEVQAKAKATKEIFDGKPIWFRPSPTLRRALEELMFFSREYRVLGVYPAATFRQEQDAD
jgi:hypothetical protein